MKTGLGLFFRLAWRTYFPGDDQLGQRTWQRLFVMTLFLPAYLAVQLIHGSALLLDELLFPGYRRVQVRQPLFIVGVPRSGTTFLHRLIARDSARFTTFPLWELLLAPAITEKLFWIGLDRCDRLVGRPLYRILRAAESLLFGRLDQTHKTSLLDPEEDYLALLPILACFLLVLPFPHGDGIWKLAYFDQWPPEHRQRVMGFYKRIVQRHLYVRGTRKQLLSKNPSFSPMVESLRQSFPDCCIVCNLRSPCETVPSLLSTMMDGARIFGNAVQGNEYRDRLLEMVRFFYRHLADTLPSANSARHFFVRFHDLTSNPECVVQTLYEGLQYEMSPQYAAALRFEHERAQGYRSGHRYSLEQFELTADRIRHDLSFVFELYGLESDYGGSELSRDHLSSSSC